MRDTVPTEGEVLARIREAMADYLSRNAAPEEVRDFLVRHWARLMTGIFMARGNQDADWNSGWDTVNALLWSLAPKRGRQETEKMLRMLTEILTRLHQGCAALALSGEEQDLFFGRLAMMHAAVARDGLKFRAEPEANMTRLAAMSEDAGEAGISGLERSVPMDVDRTEKPGPDPYRELPPLRVGDHVYFALAGETRWLRLNWVSPVGGMYLFANDQGLDALTLTRTRLAERFHAGTAWLEPPVLRG